MPSLLEQIARQKAAQRRSPVSVYAPGRQMQQTITPPPRQAPRSQLDQMVEAFSTTPEAQKEVQKQAEKEAAAKRPLWGKGLGVVFGNPVSRALFSGLDYLSYPRRAVEVGVQSLAPVLPEWLEGPLTMGVDEDKARAEKRSVWDRISDPEYGYGQIMTQSDNKWLNRGLGLTGDVVLDPLTYITGGATKTVQGAESAAAAERAAAASGLADDALKKIIEGGDDVARQSQAFARMTAERAAEAAAEAARVRQVRYGVPALGNRAGRLAEVAELSRTHPGLFDEYANELQQIAQKGYSAAKSEAVRSALGLERPALRFAGAAIPGTEGIARGLQAAGGAIRGAANSSPLLNLARGSAGTEQEIAELVGGRLTGGKDEVLQAATKLGMKNIMREGREVEMAGNTILSQLTRDQLGKMNPVERAAIVHEAETPGVRNSLNEFFDQVANLYERVAGRKVVRYSGGADNYVPHMMTPRFRRFLAEGGPEADAFMKQAGLTTVDLLEGSGYLEKARKLVPGAKIKLAGREVEIGDGTIVDLNDKLRQVFPEFQGKFYEDDPIRIGEAYVSSLAKGAGKVKAEEAYAKSANPLVVKVEGDVKYQLDRYNEALQSQEPVYDLLRQGAPAEAMRAGARPARAEIPESEFFGQAVNRAETKARTAWLEGEGATRAGAMRVERKRTFDDLVEKVKAGRERLKQELSDVAERKEPPIAPRIQKARVQSLERKLARLEADSSLDQRELATFLVESRLQIESLQSDLTKMERSWGRRITKAQREAAAKVERHVEAIQRMEQRALALTGDPAAVSEQVARRMEELNRPVRQAEAALQAKIDQFPPPHPPEVVAAAQQRVVRSQPREGFTAQPARSVDILDPSSGERLTLTKARQVLRENREWEANLRAQTQQERRNVELQKILASRQRSKGRVRIGEFEFPEAETEAETLQQARLSSEQARRVSETAREAERTKVFRQDAARAAARVEATAQRDEALAPLRQQLATAQGEQKRVLKETVDRLTVLDNEINSTRAQVWSNRDLLAQVRQQQAEMTQAIKQYQKLSTSMAKSKVRSIDDLVKVALEPMEKIIAQNPNLDDEILNQTEALLHDAAQRIWDLADKDLGQKSVDNLIQQARDGKLAKVMLATVNDNWKLTRAGDRVVAGDVLVDAELHRRFQHLFELQRQPGLLGRTLNSMTNLFKTYATLSPGFHVRNALSAIFMNTSDGVSLKAQNDAVGLWRQYIAKGEPWLLDQPQEVRDAFTVIAATGAGGRFTESGVAETIDATKAGAAIYNKLASNRATRASQRAGTHVEAVVRLGMALDSMRVGDTISGAVQRISRVHFDYGDVSRLDQTAKRLIPFWTFMSRNMPLQVSQMWTKPRAYAIYANLTRNFSVADEPNTPGYWKDAGAFNTGLRVPKNNLPILGRASDLPIYIQPDLGFTRLQQDVGDVEDALSGENPLGLLSNFNPFFTAPAEYATRMDFYTGQRFEEGQDFQDPQGIMKLLQPLAALTGNTNGQGQIDPRFVNALSAVNPIQGRAERLAPQITGGDDEAKRRQAESIARFLGIPIRTLTPKQQDNEYLRRYYEALDKLKQQQQLAAAG